MTLAQAVRVALESIQREKTKIAWDANCWERYHTGSVHQRNCYERRAKLRQAEQVLRAMVDAKHGLPLLEKQP